MVLKTRVRKAVRLAPIFASLTALAMVAACARTNGKAQISQEKREKAAMVVSSKLFPDYNEAAPANVDFAGHFLGASIIVHGRDDKNVHATIKILLDNRKEPVIVRDLIPIAEGKTHVMPNANTADKSDDIKVEAGCGTTDCKVISARLSLMGVAEPAVKPEGAEGSATIAAKVAVSVPTSSAQAVATTAPAPSSPEGGAPAADAAPQVEAAPAAETPKVLVAKAANVISFTIETAAESKEETLLQKSMRLSKMSLITSGTTAKGPGSLDSFEVAYQKATGQAAPADEEVTPLTAPIKDETVEQPAPPEQREGTPAAPVEGSAPAGAAAPAAEEPTEGAAAPTEATKPATTAAPVAAAPAPTAKKPATTPAPAAAAAKAGSTKARTPVSTARTQAKK